MATLWIHYWILSSIVDEGITVLCTTTINNINIIDTFSVNPLLDPMQCIWYCFFHLQNYLFWIEFVRIWRYIQFPFVVGVTFLCPLWIPVRNPTFLVGLHIFNFFGMLDSGSYYCICLIMIVWFFFKLRCLYLFV